MDLELKKVCICGHFGFGAELVNGQTIKTKIVADSIQRLIGKDQVMFWDTHGGLRSLIKLPILGFRMMRRCRNILIFPAQNGLKVIVPLLSAYNLLFRRSLHYSVIGGWLPEFLKNRKLLSMLLKRFDGIYVETATMKRSMEEAGFRNVRIVPNCKAMEPLQSAALTCGTQPYRLCTFSRVMREKGIEDAVAAVHGINARMGRTVYTLDIFGPVENGQQDWFAELCESFSDAVSYRGSVDPEKSVEILKDYFALLFPTRFYTEGVPGTIIDAYMAGVPVIASAWESWADVIDEGETGLCFPFGSAGQLEKLLTDAALQPDLLFAMKRKCLDKAWSFTADAVVGDMLAGFSD